MDRVRPMVIFAAVMVAASGAALAAETPAPATVDGVLDRVDRAFPDRARVTTRMKLTERPEEIDIEREVQRAVERQSAAAPNERERARIREWNRWHFGLRASGQWPEKDVVCAYAPGMALLTQGPEDGAPSLAADSRQLYRDGSRYEDYGAAGGSVGAVRISKDDGRRGVTQPLAWPFLWGEPLSGMIDSARAQVTRVGDEILLSAPLLDESLPVGYRRLYAGATLDARFSAKGPPYPVRMSLHRDGVIVQELMAQGRQSFGGFNYPKVLEIRHPSRRGGQPLRRYTWTITSVETGKSVPDSLFEPPGGRKALVTDERQPGPPARSAVDEKGNVVATYPAHAPASSGVHTEASHTATASRLRWFALVLALLGLALAWRRRRHSSNAQVGEETDTRV